MAGTQFAEQNLQDGQDQQADEEPVRVLAPEVDESSHAVDSESNAVGPLKRRRASLGRLLAGRSATLIAGAILQRHCTARSRDGGRVNCNQEIGQIGD